MAWINNYLPHFYVDVIIYRYPNLKSYLAIPYY